MAVEAKGDLAADAPDVSVGRDEEEESSEEQEGTVAEC